MKVKTHTVFDIMSRLRVYFQNDVGNPNLHNEQPFRAELFNSDQMELHAKVVADSHSIQKGQSPDKLLKRLNDNEKTLLEVRNLLVESIRNDQPITPAAEWLLDNFYLIEEQIVIARKHLPKGYSEALPSLSASNSVGMPRVYDIILEIISHSDGRVDVKSLSQFIASYQTLKTLTLGELWAVPIMLRLGVIENLRRISERTALDMIDTNLAGYWADKMLETVKENPANLVLTIADMARSKPILESPFVACFIRKLQGKGSSLSLATNWMEQQLARSGISSNDLIWKENQKQAADQVSVRNSIFTLRLFSATDWRDFVESLSSVEQVLRKDNTGTYPQMDFSTRDRYRHVVEVIAKASPLTETEVAQMVVDFVQESHLKGEKPERHNQIGYFLTDKGRSKVEKAAKMRYTIRQKLNRFVDNRPVFLYLFSIAYLTAFGTAILFYVAYHFGNFQWQMLTLVGFLSAAGSCHLAVSFINWLATIWVKPKLLSRLDFSKGIPGNCQTFIAIPSLLSSKKEIEELAQALEVRYLANREANLYFGLLTDFTDSDLEFMPKDSALLQFASNKIVELNEKYKHSRSDKFFLFHRPRKWNSKERKWMGYERKRGKLSALNNLLRGRGESEFFHIVGDYKELMNVRYVITLDSDTQLPREAAWKIIATIAHPLNHAVLDSKKRRVIEGYGILQPRVASVFPKDETSLYLRMQGDMKGIDPYTRASSDIYQDIFGEGSFIGKGIYDIDVFEQVVGQCFQDNRILSHDLLEGCYARSGLLSDILLYEQNPSQYKANIKRHQRWIRGDWQIAVWVMPFVPDKNGRLYLNPISVLSKWKIFDNLRRSLLPLSLLLILLLGWFILPYPWFWTLAVTIIILLPVIAAAFLHLIRRPEELNIKAHVFEVWSSLREVLLQFTFGLAVLPYEAYRYTGAILRAQWRMWISKRKLLEWVSFAMASHYNKTSIWSNYKSMWIGPILSIICICIFLNNNHPAFFVASPILILWILAPAIAWRLSIPEMDEAPKLTDPQRQFLHKAARRTWFYFQQFVTANDNWLPPDNFQEHPEPVIAHRTSPTNMGMSLLANLAASDFGYISTHELIERSDKSLRTMLKLDRFKGHFYNWYDTQSLSTLTPRYVSTVDSGNLLGSLLILRQGLLSLPDEPLFNIRSFEGINTTLEILKDLSGATEKNLMIEKILAYLEDVLHEKSNTLSTIKHHLDNLILFSNELILWEKGNETSLEDWTKQLHSQLKNLRHDLSLQIPWLDLLPIPGHFIQLQLLDYNLSPRSIQDMMSEILHHIDYFDQHESESENREWLKNIRASIIKSQTLFSSFDMHIKELAEHCEQMSDIEYDFLFEKSTNLLRIGFNVDELQKDESYYDMLASEARLGVFIGIAQGKIPQESWFSLGRLLTSSNSEPVLLSWSGSMFEYLMPQLIMPSFENTLLDQTNIATVKGQIDYAKKRGIPWGISESGYNSVDANLNYQYRAFGVPGLGLKRGLEEDLVIAPYASMLALMILPMKAASNLQLLSLGGFEGQYGFYEAIDYTPSRLPRGSSHVVINSYMTHHQGMSLLSMAYVLLNKPMQKRFRSELRFQASLLLLQERIPKISIFYAHTADISEVHPTISDVQIRSIKTPNTPIPELQLLSNGRYQVMITNSGGGYSHWKDISVTRWREDSTLDNHGIFCYIKDVESGNLWSNTYQPTLHPAADYEAVFSQGHVEFHRQDYGIVTKTEVVVSPEDDTEIRKIKISNRTQSIKTLEITSYSEIVLASQASDESHPAFSNLFVQTEIIEDYNAIFATRRPRSKDENPPYLFHLMDVHGASVEEISYETDRMTFIGRGRNLTHPQAADEKLSGSQGSVLDPIMAIRYRVSIRPHQTATVDLIFGISETRKSTEELMHKYRDRILKKRAFELSWTHSQVLLRQIKATEADAQLFGKLASSIIYTNSNLRAESSIINSNSKGQSGLWSHSISGDLPIVLLQIFNLNSLDFVIRMLQAHAYWQLKGLAVDLVIWNDDHGAYRHELQDQIMGLVSSEAVTRLTKNQPGNIYVKSSDQISSEDRVLFESVARVILNDKDGTLSEQITRHRPEKLLPPLLDLNTIIPSTNDHQVSLPNDLLFFNGIGGFTADGKEYKIIIEKNKTTPAPWVNIIANPYFGSVLSESGSAYTWALNAHEYRITPWSNDSVSDISGEAFYLRDEETGKFWSASPFPAPSETPYITTHGFGYTKYVHIEKGVHSKMKVFVDQKWPIKFITLKIKNQSGRPRKFSATGFLEIILGDLRSKTNMHILSEYDNESETLLFRNRYNSAFAERVSFFKVIGGSNLSFTTDRAEFIGRNRNLVNPEALNRKRLSGRVMSGMDTCAALQVNFELLDGETKDIIFQIGNESNSLAVKNLIQTFKEPISIKNSFKEVMNYWNEALGAVQVLTPDHALNTLANGWLTYQTIASRLFAKSGFYQSGGAFGFRDQLQDVLSLFHTKPLLAREQILLNASRQFIEGDVQHWWHPPEGRGVRTRCSDDLLWMPFAVYRYLKATGDTSILREPTGYLESRLLHEGEDSFYDLPVSGNLKGSLYDHCVRAINHSLRFGKHGLPLIGSGDWNDGMDQVGNKGHGESVWLAFFLYDILLNFSKIAEDNGDAAFAQTCTLEAGKLQSNIEASAWDGEWYKRAWFDDGTPLGSKENTECKIDAISQSWSVLSTAASVERRSIALDSLNKYLVNRELKVIQLLDPPFDTSDLEPGYIKGYVPGVRENGGQYSHAAIWSLMAFAALGDREKTYELFSMVQPINHALDAGASEIYKVEPYVMAADVYANISHRGRGGWTWYTGSAGWMYQFILNSMIGLELLVDKLKFTPCFPSEWPSVYVEYRFKKTTYKITVYQQSDLKEAWWRIDDKKGVGNMIQLIDDEKEHIVEVHV